MNDRNPLQYIPPEFQQRATLWLDAAKSLVADETPYAYMAVETLMFAERPILAMENRPADRQDKEREPSEPLLLVECSTLSVLWICGLYEITRGLRAAKSPRAPHFLDLHRKLEVLRVPLAKHEVWHNSDRSHHPTSIWCPDTGHVGWQVFNPQTDLMESYYRTRLADEFLSLSRCTQG
jgi:hypothetical protein